MIDFLKNLFRKKEKKERVYIYGYKFDIDRSVFMQNEDKFKNIDPIYVAGDLIRDQFGKHFEGKIVVFENCNFNIKDFQKVVVKIKKEGKQISKRDFLIDVMNTKQKT